MKHGMTLDNPIDATLRAKLANLTAKERYYTVNMLSGNTPVLIGKPGTAKSAIWTGIAAKLEWQHRTQWLSRMDETDFSLPKANDKKANQKFASHSMTVPEWALEVNEIAEAGTHVIVHMEELNRCSQGVMNATLGMFQERTLGNNFFFHPLVHFVASGNQGDKDGTVVNEFDNALLTRLVIIPHHLTTDEWIEGFANDHVHPHIVSFLKAQPTLGYKMPSNSSKDDNEGIARPFPTYRTWHNLSKYITTACGWEAGMDEVLTEVTLHGIDFIGKDVTTFIRWLEDASQISVKDILNRYDQVKGSVKESRIPEFFEGLKAMQWADLKEAQVKNLEAFFKDVQAKRLDDQLMSYFQEAITKSKNADLKGTAQKSPAHMEFLKSFKDYILKAGNKAGLKTSK